MKTLVRFPKDYPKVSSAIMLRDNRTILTGHENGLLVSSDLVSGKSRVLDDCHFEVTSISVSNGGEAVVGCYSGLIYTLPLAKPEGKRTIQEPGFGTRDRVWRLIWVNDSTFVEASTYGVVSVFSRDLTGNWTVASLEGHSDSVFGLGAKGSLLASGDWRGNIIVWKINDSGFEPLDRIKIQTGVQAIAWHSDELFAVVDRIGRVHVFESQDSEQWRLVYETDTATSRGSSIHITQDGSSVYTGTQTELMQFDLDNQQIEPFTFSNVKGVFSDESRVYVVLDSEISELARKKISIPERVAKYRFAKISLIGHTGVGKSTLASNFVKRSAEGIESTFGKRLWIKDLPVAGDDGPPPRKIILHDHGGQESVLGTYLPFLTDSDVILVVFQKTDYDTFEDALKILDELTEVTTKRTKIFLVQTFGDMKMADINPQRINELRESGRIIDFVSLDSRSLAEVDSLFSRVMHEISWESERIMIESAYADGILRTVAKLYDAHSTVVPLDKVHDSFKEIMGFDVSNAHMKFLLRNLASQGFVEYYPEILDRLVLNDDNYNRLRTEIPIFVRNHQGIVKTDSILQNFTPADYAAMIDKLFLVYKISIENDGLRLFPAKLKTGPVEIPRRYKALLEKSPQLRRSYRRQSVKTERILEALSDLKLRCIDAAQKGGLFAWEENACIYYSFGDVADSIRGDTLQFQFYVGGTNEKISDRLTIEFSEIIDRFFGPPLETEDNRKKFLSATSTT